MKEFGSDWSRQKLLCYNVQGAVITTLGRLELMKDHITGEREAGKLLNDALKVMQIAAGQVEELYQGICRAERPR